MPGPLTFVGRRVFAGLVCALLAAVAVGFAAGQNRGKSGRPAVAAPVGPGCARAAKAVGRPDEVPAAVLPPGTVLTSVVRSPGGVTLVTGVVPSEFRNAVQFFVTKLPAAGFRNGVGDAEMDEAEALFSGPGVQGKWKVNGILGCPGAVTLALYVRS